MFEDLEGWGDPVGIVTRYFPASHAALVLVENQAIRKGDTIRIVGQGIDFTEPVKTLELGQRHIHSAHPGEQVGLHVPIPVHEQDRVFLVHRR